MKSHQTPNSDPSSQTNRISQPLSHIERFAVAYAQFDADLTSQFQELEDRFRRYWTPRALQKEFQSLRRK